MRRLAIISDLHAGWGAGEKQATALQRTAIERSVAYLDGQELDELIINGDTTDHVGNALSGETDPDVSRDVLASLVRLIQKRQHAMRTVLLSGNTDWSIASVSPEIKQQFFDASGLQEEDVTIPWGALWHEVQLDGLHVVVTHGHALKPAVWNYQEPRYMSITKYLLEQLRYPSGDFLSAINAVDGAHRQDYLKAVRVGSKVQQLPYRLRQLANYFAGKYKMTGEYEPHFGRLLEQYSHTISRKILGVMGHTHVAGVGKYHGQTILNTGTTGAKPTPLQRLSDPKAHLAVIDELHGTIELVQTYDAHRPSLKPEVVMRGVFKDV